MITSATPQEGKSTTVANLAVAFAQAGRRVVLCDLDARRPMIQSLFRLPPQPGLTDVATGAARLEDVLTRVPIPEKPYWRRNDLRNGQRRGGLEVLTVGGIPKDAGELVGSEGLVEILERLRARADLVLLDTPAMLAVGDAMTVAGVADAVIGVARLGVVRRSKLRELAQALAASPAAPLGFVATGSLLGDRYGLDWYYHHPAVLAEQRESIQR